jgi:hypothetical protein
MAKPTRKWYTREEATNLTASLEGIFLTAAVDAKEKRDVMSADVPNAFIQTTIPEGEEKSCHEDQRSHIEVSRGAGSQSLWSLCCDGKGKESSLPPSEESLYGMLVASLLWFKKFREDLETQGSKFNPDDLCIANRWVDHKRHTVRFHVDNLMSSHVDPKVNNKLLEWLNKMYGSHGEVKATRE